MKLLPDILSIIGVGSIGYGLYQFEPWTAFVCVGALLLIAGLRLGRETKE